MTQFIQFASYPDGAAIIVTLNVNAISTVIMTGGGVATIHTLDGQKIKINGEMNAKLTAMLDLTEMT